MDFFEYIHKKKQINPATVNWPHMGTARMRKYGFFVISRQPMALGRTSRCAVLVCYRLHSHLEVHQAAP